METDKVKSILTGRPFAHRGLHTDDQEVPENSLLSFRQAVQNDYAIELDVQLSADGKVMVFHDENLLRMTGIDRELADIDSMDLQRVSLLSSRQGIPLLEEVLALTAGKVPLLIEIKNRGRAGKLEENLLAALKDYTGPYAVQSFNPLTIGYFKRMAPHIIRGQLAGSLVGEDLPFYKKFLLKYLLLNFISRPHFVAYEAGSLPNWLARILKQKKIFLLVWTVRSQAEAEQLPAGVDNIIFEMFSASRPWRQKLKNYRY